jgi:hypothetical protein
MVLITLVCVEPAGRPRGEGHRSDPPSAASRDRNRSLESSAARPAQVFASRRSLGGAPPGIRTPNPLIPGPQLWFFVDSAGHLRVSRRQTLVICGLLVVWVCLVTIKCPNDHQRNVITDDLARWELWGIPSTVRWDVGGAAR